MTLGVIAATAALGAAPAYAEDTTAPDLHDVPADITAEATGSHSAVVNYTNPTATDDIDPNPDVACFPASGSTFHLGTTPVDCTATDASGNQSSDTFSVTVQDTTPPSITAPSPITAEATGDGGATVDVGTPTASDSDGVLSVACGPAGPRFFPIGTTTVTCTATDYAGLSSSATTTVTVWDTTPPSIKAPPPIVTEATSSHGATVDVGTPTASDIAGGVSVACSPASPSTFPIGKTTVTCTATDDAGLVSSDDTTVTVQDTTPPSIHKPADVTAEATGPDGARVLFDPVASDVAGPVSVVCSPANPGETFALGDTTVTCTATDEVGLQASVTFSVTVQDTTPPSIEQPADVTAEATGPDGAVVAYTDPAASDVVDDSPDVACSPASGSTFALGDTTVTCTATDNAGNHASSTFNVKVKVKDTTPPVLHLPTPVADATSPSGATVTYSASATDAVDGSVPVSCDKASGSVFAIGSTTVSCHAQDAAGNQASGSFQVLVRAAADQVSDLATAIKNVNLKQGIANSIDTKLADAQAALTQAKQGDKTSTCGKLGSVDNQIQSQAVVKQITQTQADALSTRVRQIRAAIGCPAD